MSVVGAPTCGAPHELRDKPVTTEPAGPVPAPEQFMRLLLEHQSQIHHSILAMVGNWADADDVLQETIAVMWRKYEHFTPGTNFAAWAMTVARYQSLSHLKRSAQRGVRRVWLSPQTLEAVARTIEERADLHEAKMEALQKCLSRLPPRQRELLTLRYEDAATVKSIADACGRTVQAVYKALNRIHENLLRCVRNTLASERL
jgi:RNA polymerase sigma-70 factor, ECF subfamily